MREIGLRTERRTQLVEITELVEEALQPADGAAAALIYVPHTTAGVTINEDADPALAQDIESAMERIVDDSGGDQHSGAGGPQAPAPTPAAPVRPAAPLSLDGGERALRRRERGFFFQFCG